MVKHLSSMCETLDLIQSTGGKKDGGKGKGHGACISKFKHLSYTTPEEKTERTRSSSF
jgi:hypothetical protein